VNKPRVEWSYEEMAEWRRRTEIGLGRPQNAYDHEGEAMPISGQVHPDANPDGFVPPSEVDWNEVFSAESAIAAADSYEPDGDERYALGDEIESGGGTHTGPKVEVGKDEAQADLEQVDDPNYEGAPPQKESEILDRTSPDPRFIFSGLVDRWDHLADVYAAIQLSIDVDDGEPIGDEAHLLETLRCPEGSQEWYVDDILKDQLFVQHNPQMNHPLSACVREGDNYVIWVYDKGKPETFPSEPIGYMHNGKVFRRPKG
jgi:hypothetical protein